MTFTLKEFGALLVANSESAQQRGGLSCDREALGGRSFTIGESLVSRLGCQTKF
jgi:hypothetical protein